MYLREQEEGNLERATMMDRLASRALQVGAWAGPCAPVLRAGLMPKAAPASNSGGFGTGLAGPQKADSSSFLSDPKPRQAPLPWCSSPARVPSRA